MEKLLSVDPGLLIWTMINFLIFLFLLLKFGFKPMMNALKAREDGIQNSIKSAEAATENAQKLLQEAQNKLNEASKEVLTIIQKGREQSNAIINEAKEEAEKLRQEKMENAVKEITLAQEAAFKQIKYEIAGLVVDATEKIINEKLEKEKDYELINKYIENLSKN